MDEFPGLLARDFGVRPQGKAAPMSAAKSSPAAPSRSRSARAAADPTNRAAPPSYDDVFGGPPRYPSTAAASSSPPAFDFDGFTDPEPKPKHSSMPVFDKPVYDDDIFVGLPGINSSASGKYDDVFAMMSGPGAGAPWKSVGSPSYDDLLGSLGRGMPAGKGPGGRRSAETKGRDVSGFEDLLPGFGRKNSPQQRYN